MSRMPAVVFVPRNRLSRILTSVDRTSFTDHVGRAEMAVQALAPLQKALLSDAVQRLACLCREEETTVFEGCGEIGRLALEIVEAARLAGRADVAEVAEGVWDLIHALSLRGAWHTGALRVHADALVVLESLPGEAPDHRRVIEELARMRTRIGADAAH